MGDFFVVYACLIALYPVLYIQRCVLASQYSPFKAPYKPLNQLPP